MKTHWVQKLPNVLEKDKHSYKYEPNGLQNGTYFVCMCVEDKKNEKKWTKGPKCENGQVFFPC